MTLVTVDDFEAAARARLPQFAYDYYRSGADEEHTLARNRDAFARYEIWYRTLVDVACPLVETTVLGATLASPIAIAPTAYHCLACPDGEKATARAAAAANSLYCASTLATTTLEDVAAAAPTGTRWFQLYVHKERAFTAGLIHRAKAAGYRAIAVTLDTPVLGRRCADVRNAFALPDGMVMANLVTFFRRICEADQGRSWRASWLRDTTRPSRGRTSNGSRARHRRFPSW